VTLRGKLLVAQLPLALALLVVGLISRSTVTSLDHDSQEILKDNYLSVLAGQRMRDSADALARSALAIVRGRTVDPVAERRATFERELVFQESNITEPGERDATERLRAAWQKFQVAYDGIARTPPPVNLEDIYFGELQSTLVVVEQSATDIVTINQDAMLHKSDRARYSAERMSSAMLGTTVVSFVLGVFASLYFTDRLTRPLSVLAQTVRRMGQGDLEARARLPGKDEVAQVASELNAMAARLGEYRSSSLGELLEAQQASQAAIDSLPDPVVVFRLGGTLLNANQAAFSLFGIDPDASGDAALAHVPKEILASIEHVREHVTAGRGAYVPRGLEEAIAVSFREGPQYFLARANVLLGEQGQTVGFSLLFQDVTRLRRFDELKTDLVATVAHEFRTPLTSLQMAIHLCVEGAVGDLTPKQTELLEVARDDCERLQTIVDDILDLSRIQNGRVELHERNISAGSLLAQALDDHRALARERGVELRISALTIERTVLADAPRVRLVLSNLLTNAIRHTPRGGLIEMRVAPDDHAVRFEVSDSGPGISTEHSARIFDRFFRVPGAPEGGAGLGLFICKEIIEAHGGRIGVESDLGQGAIFWFTLPSVSTQQSEAS
jgi:NtrC-family two-component system sensor histidine kinase KinB